MRTVDVRRSAKRKTVPEWQVYEALRLNYMISKTAWDAMGKTGKDNEGRLEAIRRIAHVAMLLQSGPICDIPTLDEVDDYEFIDVQIEDGHIDCNSMLDEILFAYGCISDCSQLEHLRSMLDELMESWGMIRRQGYHRPTVEGVSART